jgi:hypothetical protein
MVRVRAQTPTHKKQKRTDKGVRVMVTVSANTATQKTTENRFRVRVSVWLRPERRQGSTQKEKRGNIGDTRIKIQLVLAGFLIIRSIIHVLS